MERRQDLRSLALALALTNILADQNQNQNQNTTTISRSVTKLFLLTAFFQKDLHRSLFTHFSILPLFLISLSLYYLLAPSRIIRLYVTSPHPR